MVRVTIAAFTTAALCAALAMPALSTGIQTSVASPPPAPIDPWVILAASTSPRPQVLRMARDEIFRHCEIYEFEEQTPDQFRNQGWQQRFDASCAAVGGIQTPPAPVAIALAAIVAGTVYIAVDGKGSGQSVSPISPD